MTSSLGLVLALESLKETILQHCKLYPTVILAIVCEQALNGGALVAGREKEGELVTTSLEFEYLHGKSPAPPPERPGGFARRLYPSD